MEESMYQWLFIVFAVIFMFFLLLYAWERMDYELLKMKIKNMYKQLKKLIKEYEDEDMEAEELIVHGRSEKEKSQFEDCDKSDKI